MFERWLPVEPRTLSLNGNNPDVPPVRLRPGRAVFPVLEPMRGWGAKGAAWVWVGPAAQASHLWCAASAGTLELVLEAHHLAIGDQLLWGVPVDGDIAVLLWAKDGRP